MFSFKKVVFSFKPKRVWLPKITAHIARTEHLSHLLFTTSPNISKSYIEPWRGGGGDGRVKIPNSTNKYKVSRQVMTDKTFFNEKILRGHSQELLKPGIQLVVVFRIF